MRCARPSLTIASMSSNLVPNGAPLNNTESALHELYGNFFNGFSLGERRRLKSAADVRAGCGEPT